MLWTRYTMSSSNKCMTVKITFLYCSFLQFLLTQHLLFDSIYTRNSLFIVLLIETLYLSLKIEYCQSVVPMSTSFESNFSERIILNICHTHLQWINRFRKPAVCKWRNICERRCVLAPQKPLSDARHWRWELPTGMPFFGQKRSFCILDHIGVFQAIPKKTQTSIFGLRPV